LKDVNTKDVGLHILLWINGWWFVCWIKEPNIPSIVVVWLSRRIVATINGYFEFDLLKITNES